MHYITCNQQKKNQPSPTMLLVTSARTFNIFSLPLAPLIFKQQWKRSYKNRKSHFSKYFLI